MNAAPAVHARSGAVPARSHIPALDGVRGLAVLMVFVYHYGGGTHSSVRAMQIFGALNKGGWSGVVLFFVLSGFLITGILWDSFGQPEWWRNFFARRVLRIFPLYYLALLILLLGAVPRGTASVVASRLWIPVLFLENLPHLASVNDNLPSAVPVFHLWSIAVEEQFYLLWPFLLVIQRSRRTAQILCLALFAGSAALRFVLAGDPASARAWEHSLPIQAGALALGGFVALSARGPEWRAILRWAPVIAAAGLVGYLSSGWTSGDFTTAGRFMMTFGLPSITLFFAALIALASSPGVVSSIFSVGWLRWLGTISYGLYVFHILLFPVIEAVSKRLAPHAGLMVRNLVQFVVAAVLSVAAATLSFHIYEKQFLRLKRYFAPRERGRSMESRRELAR